MFEILKRRRNKTHARLEPAPLSTKIESSEQPFHSSFPYDDLPHELKMRILEYVFAGWTRHAPTLKVPRGSLGTYRLADHYTDISRDRPIPSELTLHLDPRFHQLFVSRDFLETALPVFARLHLVFVRLGSHRTICLDSKGNDILGHTLRSLLKNARMISILCDFLTREEHLDAERLVPLLSPSRLTQCNIVIEKPHFWFRDVQDLRTVLTGHEMRFAWKHINQIRVFTDEEFNNLKHGKCPPEGLLHLFTGPHAPYEVTWFRETLLPMLRDSTFTGSACFEMDVVADQNAVPNTYLMPYSFLFLINGGDLAIRDVDASVIVNRPWAMSQVGRSNWGGYLYN